MSGDAGQKMQGSEPAVRVENLTLRAGNRVLLSDASMVIQEGELAVLLGGSGTGKSLLLRLLAGILPEGDGVVHEGTAEVTKGFPGLVFQEGALFEELSALENLRFAADHGKGRDEKRLGELLERLQLDASLRLPHASGGQRRRVAVARTLASDPPVLLFDEPTAGLDPDVSAEVAELVREIHVSSGKTTLVVTHDHSGFAPRADSVWFLDPHQRTLRRLEGESVDDLLGSYAPPREVEAVSAPPALWQRLGSSFVEAAIRTGHTTVALLSSTLQLLLALVPRFPKLRWGFHYLGWYLRLVAGPGAWLYVILAGAVTGFVATYFTFEYFPYSEFTRPLITDDVLGALGFALYRVLVPVLVTLLIAARCGAAVAADLGNRTFSGQIDAMRTLRATPGRYLPTAVVWAFLAGTPLLLGLSFCVARWVSMAVFLQTNPEYAPALLDVGLHRFLRTSGSWFYDGTAWVLAKSLTSGAAIGFVSYRRGVSPKPTSGEVARGVTRTVIDSTLLVLLVHLLFALWEF